MHNGRRHALFAVVSLVATGFVARATAASDDERGPVTFAGLVLDDRRAPVAGAHVTIRGAFEPAPLRRTTTADGRFEFVLPPAADEEAERGFAVFVATDDQRVGHACDGIGEEDLAAPRIRSLRSPILVAAGGRVEVDVVDADGAVADAVVELHPSYLNLALAAVRSDARGHAVIDPAPVGDFTLWASKPGRGRAAVEAHVVRGAACTVRAGLRPLRTLRVEVVDTDDGRPIAGAEVTVMRSSEGPNPGPFPNGNRAEPCDVVPRRTTADGHLELRGIEAESLLELDARSDHHAAYWMTKEPPEGADCPVGEFEGKSTRQVVSADAGSVRLEMKRRPRGTLQFTIDASTGPVPADGTVLDVRQFRCFRWRRDDSAIPLSAVVRGGAVVVDAELLPGRMNARPKVFWWAGAPDEAIAELRSRPEGGDGTARFAGSSSLAVTLLAPDGTRRADRPVSLMHEPFEDGELSAPQFDGVTDALGVVRFADLRAGRWRVQSEDVHRFVELGGGATAVTLPSRVPAEIVFEFTVGKERRLPDELPLYVDGEIGSLRREDPARGDVHVFVVRPGDGRSAHFQLHVAGICPRASASVLPELPEGRPLVVPIRLPERHDCEAIARLRGRLPDAIANWRPQVVLERREGTTGAFVFERLGTPLGVGPEQEPSVRWSDLAPGTYRLAIDRSPLHGAATEVVAGGPPADLVLDASTWAAVEVVWKVPKDEDDQFLSLVDPADDGMTGASSGRPQEWWWWNGEESWPVAREPTRSFPLLFDRAAPPSLVIRHPYLVASPLNDAIDLTKPRSTITLHAEAGPLVTMTYGLAFETIEAEPGEVHAPARVDSEEMWNGAWVTCAALDAPSQPVDVRRALRRGKTFAMAPPSAGRRRVLVDPVVMAPVELADVAFDGGPRDLGEIRFASGSTLTVHARATAPFVASPVTARATRIDGLEYRRASSEADAKSAPFDPKIRALGAGLFRVVVDEAGGGGGSWTAEVRLDGVHDAELTILTD